MNILVLCTGNSARSILLETLLNDAGGGRVRAFSAGSHPTGAVHPQSLVLLESLNHDTRNARSKSWNEFATEDAPMMDIVITVCGTAANETCPIWPGAPARSHWGVADPAAADPADQEAAFRTAYDILARRARAFLDRPIETMDAGELDAHLDNVSRIT